MLGKGTRIPNISENPFNRMTSNLRLLNVKLLTSSTESKYYTLKRQQVQITTSCLISPSTHSPFESLAIRSQ